VEVPITVRYAETDQMRVAYHAHYLVWFNEARDALMERLGVTVAEGEDAGYLMPVVEALVRYRRTALYGDELTVRAEPERTTVARLVVNYRITKRNGSCLVATGRTVSALLDRNGRTLIRVPERFAEVMRRLEEVT
jgi:acyl-CoA thioester hydrolase